MGKVTPFEHWPGVDRAAFTALFVGRTAKKRSTSTMGRRKP